VTPKFRQAMFESVTVPTRLLAIVAGRSRLLNYAYIIFDPLNRDAILIDPGWDPGFILHVITGRELKLRGIFISHSHRDHWQAVPELAKALDCPVYISRLEAEASGIAETGWQLFDHGDVFIFGCICIHSLLTPGHTIGSASFLAGDRLFTGDTLFMEGCGLCAEPGGRLDDMFDTIQFLKDEIQSDVRVFPGHKYRSAVGQPFGELMRSNIYLRIQNRAIFDEFCGRKVRQSNKPPPFDTKILEPSRLIDFEKEFTNPYKVKMGLEGGRNDYQT